jgi:hypothetical protein
MRGFKDDDEEDDAVGHALSGKPDFNHSKSVTFVTAEESGAVSLRHRKGPQSDSGSSITRPNTRARSAAETLNVESGQTASQKKKEARRKRFWRNLRMHFSMRYWLHLLDKNLPIFNPTHPLRLAWDMLMLLLVLFVCIEVPFAVGFGYEPLYFPPFPSEVPPGQPLPPSWPPAPGPTQSTVAKNMIILGIVINVLFWLDLVSNFRLAYYDSTATLIRSGSEIARAYLKLWFWIDLCACIPWAEVSRAQGRR